MTLLIAADNPTPDAKTSKRFGHAKFYLLVDENGNILETLKGPDESEPMTIFDHIPHRKIDGVITGNIGPGAFRKLSLQRIPVYICRNMTAKEAVKKVVSGEIAPADNPTMKKSVRGGKNH